MNENMIKIEKEEYRLKCLNIDKQDKNNIFYIKDLIKYMEKYEVNSKVMEIKEIWVKPELRNKGVGTSILREICSRNEDKIIIMVSQVLRKEFTKPPAYETLVNINKRLSEYYENLGFINVNRYIGKYNVKNTFIYPNQSSGKLISKLLNNN